MVFWDTEVFKVRFLPAILILRRGSTMAYYLDFKCDVPDTEKPRLTGMIGGPEGAGRTYIVDTPLASGGRGLTYRGHCVETGQQVVAKAPKLGREFPVQQVKVRMKELYDEALAEITIDIRRLREVRSVAHALDACAYWIQDLYQPALIGIFEFVDGRPLHEYLRQRFPDRIPPVDEGGSQGFLGITDYEAWWDLAHDLATCLRDVHRRRIVHSDLWPPNILIQRPDDSTRLIDFGAAWDLHEMPHRLGAPGKAHRYMAPERRTEQAWRTPVDIYSYGMVLLYLALGVPPDAFDDPIEDNDELKRTLFSLFRELNPQLLEAERGVVDIIHRCLRFQQSSRAATMQEVIFDLELFAPQKVYEQAAKNDAVPVLRDCIAQIQHKLDSIAGADHLFLGFVQDDISDIAERIEQCTTRLYEVTGDRERLLHGLFRCLQELQQGDMFAAVTLPALWSSQGIGMNGRYLTLNVRAAQRGVWVKRVFVVTSRELRQQRVRETLAVQQSAFEEILSGGLSAVDSKLDSPGCFIGYTVVSEEERERMILHARNSILIRRRGQYTRVALDYQMDGDHLQRVSRLTGIRFWNAESDDRLDWYQSEMEEYLCRARHIARLDLGRQA